MQLTGALSKVGSMFKTLCALLIFHTVHANRHRVHYAYHIFQHSCIHTKLRIIDNEELAIPL